MLVSLLREYATKRATSTETVVQQPLGCSDWAVNNKGQEHLFKWKMKTHSR